MMKSKIIIVISMFFLILLAGCWGNGKHKEVTPPGADLTVQGGADSAEQAMREYCQAMGQRDYEKASLFVWLKDWFDDPANLEYERKIFVDNLYKQGWKAEDRDFNKFEIISQTPKGNDIVEMKVSIGSRKGYYTEYPYTLIRHNNRWYVQIESTTGTFGINL
jgi:hypothetical protein